MLWQSISNNNYTGDTNSKSLCIRNNKLSSLLYAVIVYRVNIISLLN